MSEALVHTLLDARKALRQAAGHTESALKMKPEEAKREKLYAMLGNIKEAEALTEDIVFMISNEVTGEHKL